MSIFSDAARGVKVKGAIDFETLKLMMMEWKEWIKMGRQDGRDYGRQLSLLKTLAVLAGWVGWLSGE